MDWASLKDMDVKDLLAKFKGSQAIFTDKKMLSKFGIIFGSVIIFLIFYHFWFNPKFIQPQKEKIVKMEKMKTDTAKMIENEGNLKTKIKNLKPKFDEQTSLFHSDAEFDNLITIMTKTAKEYGLSVDEMLSGEQVPVYDQSTGDTSGENLGTLSYYTLPVTWKITGTYLGYLKYRQKISKRKQYIYFHKETITVRKNSNPGEILAEGKLSIVQLPD